MSGENNDDLHFLKSPWVTALSLFLGIAGIAFAVYTHMASQKEKSLSIIVDQDVTPIIDSKKVKGSNFSVVDKSGEKIEGDISAFKIKIINDGDVSIWGKDILSPVEVTFPDLNSNPFIEFSIEQNQRTNIIKPIVKLTDVVEDISFYEGYTGPPPKIDSTFSIDFKILEGGDFISIAVIYLGSETPLHYIKGSIEGVPKISISKPASKRKTPKLLIGLVVLSTTSILFLLYVILFFYKNSRAHPQERKRIENHMNKIHLALAIVAIATIIFITIFT